MPEMKPPAVASDVARWALCLLLSGLAACAAAPKKRTPQDVALAAIKAGIPPCQPARPDAVSGGVVTARPGETLCISVQVEDKSLMPIGVLASASPETPAIVVRVWQEPGVPDVFMSIYNPFGENLKYRAGMLLPGEQEHQRTSSCAVIEHGMGIESWPHAVTELVLADFQLIGNSPELMCE